MIKTKQVFFIIVLSFLLFFTLSSCFAIDNETDNVLTGDDYYFDSSVENDGNGSQINPYNSLTREKLVENSTIHLASGEYELDKGKSIYNISIIGENPQNTIVKFKNSSSFLTVRGSLTLQNVTLIDVTVIDYANFNATNTIFKNSIAYSTHSQASSIVNSASNSFGGAIYAPYYQNTTVNVYLTNCSFINNSAEYGGAIYMDGGNLEIKNSLFLDNFAYNYGGAIACEYNAKVTIEKSKFINSKSINDAGGAIYLRNSKFTANYLNITNSKASFGGAITSLDSKLQLGTSTLTDNVASFEGGAIYQLYGTFTLRNSNFINNKAKNGGALFIDNTTSTILYQNTFTNNSALNYAGAIYSISNPKSRINFNEYFNNSAKVESDYFNSSILNIFIENGNYSMYKFNHSNFTELPSNYSSQTQGFVTSIKDQQAGGNCWAFAGLAVLESCILKASGENLDLSEENMKNLMEIYSDYGWSMDTNSGGYPSMIMAYLLSWMGPVLENDDKYDDYSALSPLLDSIMHVQNIKYIKRSSYTDNDEIKEAVLNYGAVGTGIYFDYDYYDDKNFSYYGSFTTLTNHAVAIVGWDDSYSRDNFINKPLGDGAFIVKNSWGDDWGDNGFFYVSYYDTSFAAIGQDEASYTFILNDTIKLDKNYQYDVGKTDYFVTGYDEIWYQNVFISTGDEYLAAVSTYFEKNCEWNLSVYVNDVLKLIKNGTGMCGYYTIDLGDYIPLNTGDIFKVIFKISAKDASFPISEKIKSNKVFYDKGISFFSTDGEKWIDLHNYSTSFASHYYDSQVACIKAFTFLNNINSSISLNISNKGYNPVQIAANVENQFGYPVEGGSVIFNVDDINYTVPVVNGVAKLNITFPELKVSKINAIFNANGYLTSNTSDFVNISKIYVDLSLDVVQNMSDVVLRVNASQDIAEYIVVSVNGQSFYNSYLKLYDLENGNYSVKVSINNDTYVTNNPEANFTIYLLKTHISVNDFDGYYYGGNIYSVVLLDSNGNPVSNKEITFSIGQNSIKNITDSSGIALVNISLPVGQYDIYARFEGDNNYFNSSVMDNIVVKTSILCFDNKNYFLNSTYSVILLNKDGSPLNHTNVNLEIANKTYNLTTNADGLIEFNIGLKDGNYDIVLINTATDEKLIDVITVNPRITGNKDLTMYFSSGKSYNVLISESDATGELVTMKVNGKTYYVEVDNNGYASLKVNLNPKSYTITAMFKGYVVKNKIIVKPLLTAKNISVKKSKKIRFTAKLVNTKGKLVKGKKITFKIKGKKYKVKTNRKGKATLTLRNLKVGKYTIKTTYGKSTIKNTIKIKK